jgi:peptide/nickel transport system substrate-binding protein
LDLKDILLMETSLIKRIISKITFLVSSLRPTEKILFYFFTCIAIITGLYSLNTLNEAYSVELPVHGGTYTEGIIGYARFINPILGYSDADKDMSALVYSGLLRLSQNGALVPDLAESWSVSTDGITYTFNLKPNITFHDGTPITTEDIEYTIQKTLDPAIKSPKTDNWIGIKIEKISPSEIKFILPKPYSPFLENLTLGILPKHVWKDVDSQNFESSILNKEPIGSGPFKIYKSNVSENIYQSYDLVPFKSFSLGPSYINHLIIRFYKNEEEALIAYRNGTLNALGGISPASADNLSSNGYKILRSPLPRVFALFFNESSAPVLLNKEVRQALDVSINREILIKSILKGWGTSIHSPIPNSFSSLPQLDSGTSTDSILAGKKILESNGWKLGADGVYIKEQKSGKKTETQRLAFTISTSNIDELKATATILKDEWRKVGADISIEIFEPSDLSQKVIRPRKYDALLFGNVIGRDLDLYPFWHSSQRNDPGLNIALYTNIKADRALETIRTSSDEQKKLEALRVVEREIRTDIPAIFLYSPDYIYATTKYLHNIPLSNITSPSDRFMNVHEWYIETEKVWKIFTSKN